MEFRIIFHLWADELTGKGSDWRTGYGKEFGKRFGKEFGILRNAPEATISEIAETLNISTRAVEKNISALQKCGALKRIGGRKEGHWDVIRQKE
jgi:ATP-dependent DNA helicase RecG